MRSLLISAVDPEESEKRLARHAIKLLSATQAGQNGVERKSQNRIQQTTKLCDKDDAEFNLSNLTRPDLNLRNNCVYLS